MTVRYLKLLEALRIEFEVLQAERAFSEPSSHLTSLRSKTFVAGDALEGRRDCAQLENETLPKPVLDTRIKTISHMRNGSQCTSSVDFVSNTPINVDLVPASERYRLHSNSELCRVGHLDSMKAQVSALQPLDETGEIHEPCLAAPHKSRNGTCATVDATVDSTSLNAPHKSRKGTISTVDSMYLDTDNDVASQYDEMLKKSRKFTRSMSFMSFFHVGTDRLDKVMDCVNKKRLPFSAGRLGVFAQSRTFHSAVCTLILLNIALIVVESDLDLRRSWNESRKQSDSGGAQHMVSYVLDIFFGCIFAIELLIRILVEELSFLVGRNWKWNLFDSCLVGSSLIEATLDGSGIDATYARVLRVLRMSRALKIIRVFKVFRELRVLLDSIFHILLPLAWSALTLTLVIIMFSLIIINAVDELNLSDLDATHRRDLELYFCDAPTTFLSLFMSLTNGQSWIYIKDPLDKISPVYTLLFVAFVIFVHLGVLNIITSVFVGHAALFAELDLEMIEQAEADSHRYTMNLLTEMFTILDADDSESISLHEFEEWTRIEKVRAFFERVLGLEAWKVGRFFRLLDVNKDERIDRDEFVVGCMRLKGCAKNMDQEVITHLARGIRRDIKGLKKHLNDMKGKMDVHNQALSDALLLKTT